MTAALSSQFMPYGAPELQRAARPYMVRALMLSSLLVTTAFTLAWSLSLLLPRPEIVIGPQAAVYYPEGFRIPPPAPLVKAPPVVRPQPLAKPADAVPVPKPDASVPREQTIPSQGERDQNDGKTSTTGGAIAVAEGSGDRPVNEIGAVPFVDQYPQAIVRMKPIYPEIAMQAQVEGTVMVYVLIGKDGRVREVKLHPEKHVPMLDAAAIEAAQRWTFEPALVGGRPVAVWVLVPFKFTLH